MKKELGNILVGGLVLMAVLPALANEPTVNDGTPQVTVRVLDYADVPLTTLRGAQREAGRILSRAGVKAVWPECFLVDTPATCHQRPGTNELTVRILRRPKGKKVAFDPLSGGVAIRIGENTGSGFITLYYNRTEEIAEEFRMKRGLVLGHALAHEIGHLLLPSGAHSSWGIMQWKLSEKEWQRAAKGSLIFTRKQAGQIRDGFRSRS
jgi:hypothetical protein